MANPTCTYPIAASRQASGVSWDSYPLYYWSAVLTPYCNLVSGWVSIQAISTQTPTDCRFMWASSPAADFSSLLYDQDDQTWTVEDFDLAFCLTGEEPDFGSCCYGDPYNRLCEDMTEPECCDLSGTWYEGETCAAFECPSPPPNDSCGNAIEIQPDGSILGTTTLATMDGAPDCDGFAVTTPGVWYKVAGTGTGLTATTCNAYTDALSRNTRIHVYCGTCDELICVGANDDDCTTYSSLLSTVTWCSQAGAEYYILVSDYSVDNRGDFQLDVWEDGTPCEPTVICYCPAASDLTAHCLGDADQIEVSCTATAAGVYTFWISPNENNEAVTTPSSAHWNP